MSVGALARWTSWRSELGDGSWKLGFRISSFLRHLHFRHSASGCQSARWRGGQAADRSWELGFWISSFIRHLIFDIRPRGCLRHLLPAHPCSVRVSSVAFHSTTAAPISVGFLCVFATWRLCVKQRRAPRRRDREIFNAKARRRKDAKRGVGQAFQPDARPITLIAYTLTGHIGRHCQAGKPDLRRWHCQAGKPDLRRWHCQAGKPDLRRWTCQRRWGRARACVGGCCGAELAGCPLPHRSVPALASPFVCFAFFVVQACPSRALTLSSSPRSRPPIAPT